MNKKVSTLLAHPVYSGNMKVRPSSIGLGIWSITCGGGPDCGGGSTKMGLWDITELYRFPQRSGEFFFLQHLLIVFQKCTDCKLIRLAKF